MARLYIHANAKRAAENVSSGSPVVMSGSKLDQVVKGAPPPGTSIQTVVSRSPSPALSTPSAEPESSRSFTPPSDPLATLPSSPPQIYLNLLILEASLRTQFLDLGARRRQHTFFLFLLTVWVAWFTYLLFLRPREDGSGVGGSVYWVVEMAEKVALMGGVVTGILLWGTGQWDRGVRWPRRWVGVANRGLRNMNAKVVVIKGPWWKETLGHFAFLFPYSSFFPSNGPSYHYIDSSERSGHDDSENVSREEDLSPGGDYIKLLLLPKPFSPDFRENWEFYRLEYWERENKRRARMRHVLQKRQRELAQKENPWFWWAGWRERKSRPNLWSKADAEKSNHKQHHEKESKRQSTLRTESHSRTASRSSTPSTHDPDDRPTSTRSRRGSATTASASERRRKGKQGSSIEQSHVAKMTPVGRPA